jgi:DNA-binding NtrC family response regulator
VVICDFSLPHFSGADALRLLRGKNLDTPFVYVSGTIGEETAVAALKQGAHDYVMKDSLKRLLPAIQRELKEAEQRREKAQLERQVPAGHDSCGTGPAWRVTLGIYRAVALPFHWKNRLRDLGRGIIGGMLPAIVQ